MTLRFTILGCGASTGVPRIDGNWGHCDPANPKNRRSRAALLVERIAGDGRGKTSVLIDTGPDLRTQMLSAGLTSLDAVFYTHDHADHTHGIDDLRLMSYARRKLVDLYFDRPTGDLLISRFDYCFASRPGSSYSPIVRANFIEAGQPVTVKGAGGDITLLPFGQLHGDMGSLGFRIGSAAYSTDVHDFPAESLPALAGLDVWIVDALRHHVHASHFSVQMALDWAERLGPKRTILTHMTVDLDYDTLARELPPGVEPAYDGLTFELPYATTTISPLRVHSGDTSSST